MAEQMRTEPTRGPWCVADYRTLGSDDRPVLCGHKEWPCVASAHARTLSGKANKAQAALRDANATLIAAAPDMDLILHACLSGVAHFDGPCAEFCFNGLRYSCLNRDWSTLAAVAGRDALRAAIRLAEQGAPTNAH